MIFLKLIKYLHYRLYVWNLKNWGKNDVPQFNALLGVSFFIFVNITTFFFIILPFGYSNLLKNLTKIEILLVSFIILIINYFWLVHKNKYKITARFYEKETKKRRMRNTIILWLYGILSFVLFGITVVIASKIYRGEIW